MILDMRKASVNTYPVVIESCEEGGFFAKCTSFQGCHAEGDTYGEVIDNIREVISAYISIHKNSLSLKSNSIGLESKIRFRIPVPVN